MLLRPRQNGLSVDIHPLFILLYHYLYVTFTGATAYKNTWWCTRSESNPCSLKFTLRVFRLLVPVHDTPVQVWIELIFSPYPCNAFSKRKQREIVSFVISTTNFNPNWLSVISVMPSEVCLYLKELLFNPYIFFHLAFFPTSKSDNGAKDIQDRQVFNTGHHVSSNLHW